MSVMQTVWDTKWYCRIEKCQKVSKNDQLLLEDIKD